MIRIGGPITVRRSPGGMILPAARKAVEREAAMPGQESTSVPSRSKSSDRTGWISARCIFRGISGSSIQDRPALFEHIDSLGVLVLDLAVILPLVQQPQQFEMHRIQQSLIYMVLLCRLCVEDDLSGLKTCQMHVHHLSQNRDRVAGYAAADDQVKVARFAGSRGLQHAFGYFAAIDRVAAEARGEREIDAAKDNASQFRSFLW